MTSVPPPSPKTPDNKRLAAIVALAASIALPVTMSSEGLRTNPYMDNLASKPVPTICYGETKGVKMTDRATAKQCRDRLEKRLAEFAWEVYRCTPRIAERPYVFGATVDFTYNLGSVTYCKSSAARLFQQGQWVAGCNALGKYIYAGGKVRAGLVTRRKKDVALCLQGAA